MTGIMQNLLDRSKIILKAVKVCYIVGEDLVPEVPAFDRVVKVPITRLAVEKMGGDLFANIIIALGLLVKVTGVVSLDTTSKAVAKRVPPATVEKNMEALRIGYDQCKKFER